MHIELFETIDLNGIEALQPPNWGPLLPRFEEFIRSPKAEPLKLVHNQKLIGVGVSIFHEDSLWLACIIVHPDYRNQGLGTKITQELLNRWDRSRFSSCYLDATDLGFPVYQKLGFELEKNYAHFKFQGENKALTLSDKFLPYDQKYWKQALELDAFASQENRSCLLNKHRENVVFYVDQELHGFYLPSLHDGLIVAKNTTAGIELMKRRMMDFNYAILPLENTVGMNFLQENQFLEFRQSRRMRIGKERNWIPSYLYNRISGQLG